MAGDFSVDGTLSLNGNSLNVVNTLYLQNNPLASLVDFFNGKVTINKDGTIRAITSVADQFKVNANKSAGKGKILAGQTEITISSQFIEENSIVVVTPETVTPQTLSVTDKTGGESFKVKLAIPQPNDIDFSYLIIGQEEDGN